MCYTPIAEVQKDLDEFLSFYNERSSLSGYQCKDKTPMQTLKELQRTPINEENKAA